MRKAYQQATGGLIGLAMTAGCAGGAPRQTEIDGEPVERVEQSIQQSLGRLNALRIFDTTRLVLDLPVGTPTCYGLPCAGSESEEPFRGERARQAPRLERLAGIAETAVREEEWVQHDKGEAGAALQALTGLRVIEVSAIVQSTPANNPQCYNLPCGSDIEAADRENARRVSQVFAIVAKAKDSGL